MSLAITIGGVSKTSFFYQPGGSDFSFSLPAGARGSASLAFYALDAATGYRPAIDDAITVADGATTVFEGIIDDVEEEALAPDLDTGVLTKVTASDWNALADRVWFDGTLAAGVSLRSALTTILASSGLGALGVTLSAANMGTGLPNGPALTSDITCDGPAADAFNKLQQFTGYIWRVITGKVLTMFEPAFISCGYSLSDSDNTATGVYDAVRWSKGRSSNYINRVRVVAGPSGPGELLTQTWTGDGVIPSFSIEGLNVPSSNVWPGSVNVAGVWYPIFPVGSGFADVIEWDWETDGGTLTFKGTFLAFSVGLITLTYTPLYPFTVEVENAIEVAARGPYTGRVLAPDVLTYAEAVAYGAALVRTTATTPKVVTVKTGKGLAYPGQSVALAFAARGLAGTFLITAVDVDSADDGSLEYTLTCVDGSELNESWLDYYRDGPTSSGGGAIVVTGGGGTGSTTIVTSPAFLGGSRATAVAANPAAWMPVPNYMPFVASQSTSLRLRAYVFARSAGISVTVRLYDITAAAAVSGSTSAPITSVVATEVTASIAVIAGHAYRLEVLNGTNGEGVYGIGSLEGI
jgi:hypothetical protein